MQTAPDRRKATGRERDFVIAADRVIIALSRHWLFFANLFMGLYVGLPTLAPILAALGIELPSNIIFLAYRAACHQLPERSFFILGHQMAFCERDTAIYATMLFAGLSYGMLRPRVKPLSLLAAVLMAVPMAVDGTGQLIGLWTSTWWSRVVTGFLFGLAAVWLAYPNFDRAFVDIRGTIERKFREAGIPLRSGGSNPRN